MILALSPEIVAAARGGDRASLELLLETVWPHAYRIAKSILRHDSAAEDAAQEACATVYRTIGTLRNPQSFPSWFSRLVVRQALADLKRLDTADFQEPSTGDTTSAHAERMDIHAALAALPVKLRTVLILQHYAGLNSTEIGAAVGVPSPTVRFRLAQARKQMQRLLEDRSDCSTQTSTEVVL